MSFGDLLLIGLAVVSVLVVPRAIWRAWRQPPTPKEETPPRATPPPVEMPAGARWLVDLIKRPFMVYDYDVPEVMSNAPPPVDQGNGMQAVYVPVSGMERGPGGMAGMPDMDAEKPIGSQSAEDDITEPRVSSYLSDQEFFIFLVMQRKGNNYRLSANKIHQIVGGDRNEVLARIKALRATPPAPRYQALDEHHRAVGVMPEKV